MRFFFPIFGVFTSLYSLWCSFAGWCPTLLMISLFPPIARRLPNNPGPSISCGLDFGSSSPFVVFFPLPSFLDPSGLVLNCFSTYLLCCRSALPSVGNAPSRSSPCPTTFFFLPDFVETPTLFPGVTQSMPGLIYPFVPPPFSTPVHFLFFFLVARLGGQLFFLFLGDPFHRTCPPCQFLSCTAWFRVVTFPLFLVPTSILAFPDVSANWFFFRTF